MLVSCAQTFYIDKASVGGASKVSISSINLYFKTNPLPTNNLAGISYPKVIVYICETFNGIPIISDNRFLGKSILEYPYIMPSSDASIPTTFRFNIMPEVSTDKEYAICIYSPAAEEYSLWKNVSGDWLVGTNRPSSGPSGRNIGSYFSYIAVSPMVGLSEEEQLSKFWKAKSDTDLKFDVKLARFMIGGVRVSNVNTTKEIMYSNDVGTAVQQTDDLFSIPASAVELITYDEVSSYKEVLVGSQMAYQNTIPYPGGIYGTSEYASVAVEKTTITGPALLPNGASFNWSTIFPNANEDRWVVVKSANNIVNCRKIIAITSARAAIVSEPFTFVNNACQFMITPVGKISSFNKSSPFGLSESFIILTNSSANQRVRFVNNAIESLTVMTGGSGYSNADVLQVNGYESVANKVIGGYKGQANVRTNNSGSIVEVYLSNTGCGFVNTAAISYSFVSTSGSGATFNATIGSTLKTELRANNVFRNINVVNVPLSTILPNFEISSPNDCDYTMSITTGYSRIVDNSTKSGYYYQVTDNPIKYSLNMFQEKMLDLSPIVPVMVSRSNEFVTPASNGVVPSNIDPKFSGNFKLDVMMTNQNDFATAAIKKKPKLSFSSYIINNDATNEHTNNGNAWAKGITTKINLTRTAEDIVVYTTAYRPANTDIQVYARVYNNNDPDAYDDKEWTPLTNRNPNLLSSSINKDDFVELSFGFDTTPTVNNTITGLVTASSNSTTITGIGTTFSTDLAVDDLVSIYSPLFPDVTMVAVVDSITNNTSLDLITRVSNASFLTGTLNIDKMKYKHHAFNNVLNDNVARYYNSSMMEFDGYDVAQIKIVMLSSDPHIVPKVDDVRMVGVSA